MPPEPAFMADAACAGADVHVFFPEREDEGYTEARKVCAGCPVRAQCLDHALVNFERFGMWGGRSPSERQKEARARRLRERVEIAACGTRAGYERHRRLGERACVLCRAANAAKPVRRGSAA